MKEVEIWSHLHITCNGGKKGNSCISYSSPLLQGPPSVSAEILMGQSGISCKRLYTFPVKTQLFHSSTCTGEHHHHGSAPQVMYKQNPPHHLSASVHIWGNHKPTSPGSRWLCHHAMSVVHILFTPAKEPRPCRVGLAQSKVGDLSP